MLVFSVFRSLWMQIAPRLQRKVNCQRRTAVSFLCACYIGWYRGVEDDVWCQHVSNGEILSPLISELNTTLRMRHSDIWCLYLTQERVDANHSALADPTALPKEDCCFFLRVRLVQRCETTKRKICIYISDLNHLNMVPHVHFMIFPATVNEFNHLECAALLSGGLFCLTFFNEQIVKLQSPYISQLTGCNINTSFFFVAPFSETIFSFMWMVHL